MGLLSLLGFKRERWFEFEHTKGMSYVQAYGKPDARSMLREFFSDEPDVLRVAVTTLKEVQKPAAIAGCKRVYTPKEL